MTIGDFDRKIMLCVNKSGFCTMDLLVSKFGASARSNVRSLCAAHLLFWDSSNNDPFSHDDSESRITLTSDGECALNNFVESVRLTTKEKLCNRLWGVIATLIAEAFVLLMTNAKEVLEFLLQLL